MKNIQLFIVTLFFTSLLMGCGMKGPLYRAPIKQPVSTSNEKTEAKQNSAETQQDSTENNSQDTRESE